MKHRFHVRVDMLSVKRSSIVLDSLVVTVAILIHYPAVFDCSMSTVLSYRLQTSVCKRYTVCEYIFLTDKST